MKRLTTLLSILVLALAVGACNGDDDENNGNNGNNGGDTGVADTAEEDAASDAEGDSGPTREECLQKPDIITLCTTNDAGDCSFVCDDVGNDAGNDTSDDDAASADTSNSDSG